MMTSVSSRILILFFILGVGAFARHKKIIKDETLDGLIDIVINISLPFLYFYSLSSFATLENLKRLWLLPFGALVIAAVGYAIARFTSIFLKLSDERKKTFLFMASFTNYGFLAVPLAYMLFGEEGLFQIVLFNIGFNILFWSFGIWLLSNNQENPIRNLMNPGTISLFIGLAAGLCSIRLPAFIMDASKLVGNAAIPLAMLTVGAILPKSLGKMERGIGIIGALVLCRLIIVPALIYFLVEAVNIPHSITKAVIILQAAMPSPSMTPLVTRRYGGDPEFAANCVFFTTLFSLITVPLFISAVWG